MSKKKKRLKLSTNYRASYMQPEGGSPEVWGFLNALPREATLEAVITNCRRHGVEAIISAVDGEQGGWVHPDGTYRIE